MKLYCIPEAVMPFDKSNKHMDRYGRLLPKWDLLLECFGEKDVFKTKGWMSVAGKIKETNPKHVWNLGVSLLILDLMTLLI